MKINTNSNVYTVVYASLVVVVVAFLLAFVSKALEPTSMSNERIDKKKQILASLNIRDLSNDKVESEYDKSVTFDKIIRTDGSVYKEGNNKDKDGFTIGSKDIDDNHLPLYQCYVNGQTKYVIPLTARAFGARFGAILLLTMTRIPFMARTLAIKVKRLDLAQESPKNFFKRNLWVRNSLQRATAP